MQNTPTPAAEATNNQIMHPGSRKLFCAWEKLRAERPFAMREEFDLRSLADILPDLVVIERDHLRNSFKFRLAGTRVCELMAENLTSTDVLSGWDNFEAGVIRKHLGLTLGAYQPTLMRVRLDTDTGAEVAAEILGLPVQVRNRGRMQIIGGVFPFRAANSLGHAKITVRTLLSIRSIWTEHQDQTQPAQSPPRSFRVIHGGLSDRISTVA